MSDSNAGADSLYTLYVEDRSWLRDWRVEEDSHLYGRDQRIALLLRLFDAPLGDLADALAHTFRSDRSC